MILGFKTQINGKPTYFPEKIIKAIRTKLNVNDNIDLDYRFDIFAYDKVKPKLHTIREDKNNRWKPGAMIDFFINVRTKLMLRFAPRIRVVSTQTIEIFWYNRYKKKDLVNIFIDDYLFAEVQFGKITKVKGDLHSLAQNDGFETVDDFLAYFNNDTVGKIIHWTDLKY